MTITIVEQLDAKESEAKKHYQRLLSTHVQKYKFQSLKHLDSLNHESSRPGALICQRHVHALPDSAS